MVRFKLVGKSSYQFGKPLWEILGNLENNGIGRLITRGTFFRYPEPSFYKIMKFQAVPAPEVKVSSPFSVFIVSTIDLSFIFGFSRTNIMNGLEDVSFGSTLLFVE